MHKIFDDTDPAHRWPSLAAFLLILLFAGAADGLMEALEPIGFLTAGAVVMWTAWTLSEKAA